MEPGVLANIFSGIVKPKKKLKMQVMYVKSIDLNGKQGVRLHLNDGKLIYEDAACDPKYALNVLDTIEIGDWKLMKKDINSGKMLIVKKIVIVGRNTTKIGVVELYRPTKKDLPTTSTEDGVVASADLIISTTTTTTVTTITANKPSTSFSTITPAANTPAKTTNSV